MTFMELSMDSFNGKPIDVSTVLGLFLGGDLFHRQCKVQQWRGGQMFLHLPWLILAMHGSWVSSHVGITLANHMLYIKQM